MLGKRRACMLLGLMLVLPALFFFHVANAGQIEKAQVLLNMAEEAEASIGRATYELGLRGIPVPNAVKTLVLEGSALLEKARTFLTGGNYTGAALTAEDALRKFKSALESAYGLVPSTLTASEVKAARIMELRDELNRTRIYLSKLEVLSVQATKAGYNTTVLSNLLSSAKRRIDSGFRRLNQSDPYGASLELAEATSLLAKAKAEYGALASQVKSARAEAFLLESEEVFPVLKANVTALSVKLSAQDRNATLTALNLAQSSLESARAYLGTAKLNETVDQLVVYNQQVKVSLKYVQAVAAEAEEKPGLTSGSP